MDLLQIETERLILRKIVNEDKYALFDMLKDEEIASNCGINPLLKVEHAERIIQKWNDRMEFKEGMRWAITLKECKTFIGTVGIRFGEPGSGEIGYHLHPLYWRKGYMGEAVCKALEYGFNVFCLNRLIATVIETNIPSVNLLEKMGFRKVCTLNSFVNGQNAFMYSINSDVYALINREKTPI
ncbi:MAG: GNAT family N-acetyltransferase [Bacillaceae bacterium]